MSELDRDQRRTANSIAQHFERIAKTALDQGHIELYRAWTRAAISVREAKTMDELAEACKRGSSDGRACKGWDDAASATAIGRSFGV